MKSDCIAQGIVIGLCYAIAIAALGVASFAWYKGSFATSQVVYVVNGAIDASATSHALNRLGGSLSMTMPDNLVEYVGKLYHIDCVTSFAHTIRLFTGTLGPSWDGTSTIATCDAMTATAGFSFVVVKHAPVPFIRIISATGVTFS